jgi:hypothetical protein
MTAACMPVLAREALVIGSSTSSAAIQFAIVIPAILRIVENSHPAMLPIANLGSHRVVAVQKMVVISTLRGGFCMDLQVSRPADQGDWNLKVRGNGAWIEPGEAGYRLCAAKPGRYELMLQHDFSALYAAAESGSVNSGIAWPVNVSLANP